MPNQIRIVTLQAGEKNDSIVYHLEKEWFVRFALGPSLLGHRVRLFINHPLTEEAAKAGNYRKIWNELTWQNSSKNENDCFDAYAEFRCFIAGPFRYVFLCDTDNFEDISGSGYLQITPELSVGESGRLPLPLNAIQCQTMLSKLLGPFEEWECRLRVAKECGYNMIHLSPVQTLGISNSAYSIANQMELNPIFSSTGKQYTMEDVRKLVEKVHDEWEALVVSDVVWNHTAANSKWILEHPECAYNLQNSPYLRPAYLLDRILYHFSREVADGKWFEKGIPKEHWEHYHLDILKNILLDQVLPPHRLHEFFQVDVDKLGAEFTQRVAELGGPCTEEQPNLPLVIVQDPEYKRFGSTVNMALALLIFNRQRYDVGDEQNRQWRCLDDFRACLKSLNDDSATRCWNHLRNAVEALLGHVSYQRVADYGLKRTSYDGIHLLLPRYFEQNGEDKNLKEEEEIMYTNQGKYVMALNGWVMNDDPLLNFAEFPSKVYFRRELICWEDSVKLRYGEKPEDCPFLWKYMTDYTELTARTFYGLRLDNCHSTPLHVAEYLLEKARYIKPDLYVYAELFTRNEDIDNLFINRLGITSIVREAQNAGDSHEEGRLVFRYGGIPVSSFFQRPVRPLMSRVAHAMFFDVTHDNACPVQTRTVYDSFPSAALVAMAGCAIGSNRGFDELVPYQISVVGEERPYTSWTDAEKADVGQVNIFSGMLAGRRAINDLHYFLGTAGFDEVYVDQITEDVVAITRHNPVMHQSVILVSHTCFSPDKISRATYVPPLHIPGDLEEIIFEGCLVYDKSSGHDYGRPKGSKKVLNSPFIVGVDNYSFMIKENIHICQSEMVCAEPSLMSSMTDVEFVEFPPGSAIALRITMRPETRRSVVVLRSDLLGLGFRMRSCSGTDLEKMVHEAPSLRAILSTMTLQDLNRVLFRCHQEEADENPGMGSYFVPGVGSLVYCGLQGVILLLNAIRLKNDLGHPLCEHIRKDDWLVDYISDRLIRNHRTKELGLWFKNMFELYKAVPYNLKPCYFDAIVSGSYRIIREMVWKKMSKFINNGSSFVRNLALASVAFCAYTRSAQLPQLSDKIRSPLPTTVVNPETGSQIPALTSLAAGLPHFSCGLFRNWGRDTFIALPGILLIPGRYDEARYTILAYAGCLRHGLIPNLLGGGAFARYNCRDAVWWWLYAIKCYTEMAPDGEGILSETVRRLYPTDDAIAGQQCLEQPLADTIQEAVQRHFEGIKFRERNAGYQIDQHMTEKGFDVEVSVDLATGFIRGGNEWNCGTWMDKMGSSDKASNRGKPATPRDGSAVEIVGLSYAVLLWLQQMYVKGKFEHRGVRGKGKDGTETFWTWQMWSSQIHRHFERCFWIPLNDNEMQLDVTHPKLACVRGIYKDSFGATNAWADYQFRPNFTISVAVAPDLFSTENANRALELAEENLLGELGMKTLIDSDWAYDGYYNNADDSTEFRRAKGFNYHQGPEWVWLTGYFLRALLITAKRSQNQDVWKASVAKVQRILSRHSHHIQNSPWSSLPELTNKGGEPCADSCPAQAWSIGCIMEVMYDLHRFNAEQR